MTRRNENNDRWKISLTVISFSFVLVIALGAVIMIFAKDKEAATQTIMTAMFPVIASWVGTVLAYYFNSESLQTATKSVTDLLSREEKLKSVPVTEVMIPLNEIIYFTYSDELVAQSILDELEAEKKGLRAPIFDDKKRPLYMLHSSEITKSLYKLIGSVSDIKVLKLAELFEKDEALKKLAGSSFGVIGRDSSLADAQAAMRSVDGCQDVFITDTGGKDGVVVGWITNQIVEQNAKA